MDRTLQVRHVPAAVHRTLKVRAAEAGMSLSEYLLKELTTVAMRPTIEDVLGRIERRGPGPRGLDSARAVREERESRR